MCENRSVNRRMANLLAQSVGVMSKTEKKLYPFPKIIMVVPDVDLVKNLDEHGSSLSTSIGWIICHD